jgi:hypothetical protein
MDPKNIKLPHWLMIGLGAIGFALPWIIKVESSGSFQIPTWVIPVENGILSLIVYLGLASPSVSPSTNATAMNKFYKRTGVAALFMGSLYFGGDTACNAPVSPSSVVGPTIQTSVCILTTTATDLYINHDTWEVTVADVITTCGTDATTIATVWDAHTKAEVAEGVTPKSSFPTDGGVH